MPNLQLAAVACLFLVVPSLSAAETALRLLFLGDRGHHRPAEFAARITPVLAARGMEITYTNNVNDLNASRLATFDGLILYANIDQIERPAAVALLDFVASGKGFIPLHCASYCFRNDEEIVALIGAQFQRHGTGVFRVQPTDAGTTHPLLRGYQGFESWDETYVHTRHNEQNRVVLEYRQEGEHREPWTWVRTHGRGRVFYTAWGHDERTWTNAGFQNLVERGIRWACGGDPGAVPAVADRPEMTPRRTDLKPLEYVDATIPFYPPSRQWGTMAEPVKKMQRPVSADESIKHFVTPVGFRVELFATEPDIGKPLAMNWDERGRLWLCETLDYPNELKAPDEGRDRIRICEDTDGDHRADKFTVFAERLSIPTAIAFYRGGAIVQDGTRTLYLKDTDGDDQADVRQVLVTGWALGDTHGGVSHFQYGIDNWYYAMQGYNNSQPVFDGGTKQSQPFRMGFFRFKVAGGDQGSGPVRVTDIEFLRSTNNNTWGLGISEDGLIFGSTANGNPSEFLPIPNRYYEQVRGWSAAALSGIADSNRFEPILENIRQVDHHGGFTAAAGHALYTARAWPPEYWNRTAFVCEPTGHLIATFVLRPDGSGFRSRNSWNILASTDEWSAPIMAEVGPDGQLWVIDWYNIIVQHNPTPAGYRTGRGNAYEINLRDKSHGRIYRVVWGGEAPVAAKRSAPVARLDRDAPSAALVAGLTNDNLFWRRTAQRLILERGSNAETVGQTSDLLSSAAAENRSPESLIHALWTLRGLGESMKPLVPLLLAHPSPGVRRAALLAAGLDLPLDDQLAAQWLRESDPQVKLAALLALAEQPESPQAANFLATVSVRVDYLSDPWLRDGLTMAAAAHSRLFIEKLLQQPASAEISAELQTRVNELLRRVAEHFARGAPKQSAPEWIATLARHAGSVHVPTVLAGLAQGWPKDQPIASSESTEQALLDLFLKVAAPARGNLVLLASRLGSRTLEPHAAQIAASLLGVAADTAADERDRIAAAGQLIEFRSLDPAAVRSVLELFTPRTSPTLAQGLLEAIGKSESPEAGAAVVETLPGLTPSLRSAGLRVLLGRADWTLAMLDALDSGKIQISDLTLDQQQALAAHPNRRLAGRARRLLERGGSLPNPDRQKVLDELQPLTQRTADAVAGKEVFKKQCSKCHTHSGEGTRIGPDLTGMAVHPKHELLVHLIDPSRNVEGNFRVYAVALADGRVLTGLLAAESRTAVELIDSEAKKHSIQRDDIDQLVVSSKSLMPEGFEKQVTPDELANLLEFLTLRGRFLPLPLDKIATVVSTKGMFNNEQAQAERLIFSDWSPKTFDGIPFVLVDPQDGRQPNVVMLNGLHGTIPPRMPRTVTLPCNAPGKAIHLLSGISGWGFPAEPKGTVSLIVRLLYADGQREDHPLVNGEHFSDYIRRVDVPGSKFAFALRGQQLRYLAVIPQRSEVIQQIELVKGPDNTVPVIMAVTLESP